MILAVMIVAPVDAKPRHHRHAGLQNSHLIHGLERDRDPRGQPGYFASVGS
jgi:hypothetical protein